VFPRLRGGLFVLSLELYFYGSKKSTSSIWEGGGTGGGTPPGGPFCSAVVPTNRFYVPATSSRNPRERPKVLTHRHTDKKRFRLALAIGTSKYYLPKVLRPLPTYLLLSLALRTYVRSNFRWFLLKLFVPLPKPALTADNGHPSTTMIRSSYSMGAPRSTINQDTPSHALIQHFMSQIFICIQLKQHLNTF